MLGIGPLVLGIPDKLALLDNGVAVPAVATVPPKILLGNGMGKVQLHGDTAATFGSKFVTKHHWIIKPPGTSGMRI